MSEHLSGHAQMEANAQAHIAEVNAAKEAGFAAMQEEANAMNQQWDIEKRITSGDVQSLNEQAVINIYGTQGKTEGFVDLKGRPLSKPIKGKLELAQEEAEVVREGDGHGSQRVRDERATEADKIIDGAQSYVKDFEYMTANGWEASQAKLLLDLRDKRAADDARRQKVLVENYLDNKVAVAGQKEGTPLTEEEATAWAADRVLTMNIRQGIDMDFTAQLVWTKGIFSPKEYNKFLKSKQFTERLEDNIARLSDGAKADQDDEIRNNMNRKRLAHEQVQEAEEKGRDDDDSQPPTSEPEPVVKNEEQLGYEQTLKQLAPELAKQRKQFAKAAAEHSKSTWRFGKQKELNRIGGGLGSEFGTDALAEERKAYDDLRDRTLRVELKLAELAGVDPEHLDQMVEMAAAVDAYRLAREVQNQQKLAAGGYRKEGGKSDYYGIDTYKLEKPLGRFKEFWGRRAHAKFFSRATLEKALVLGVPSAAVGLGLSVVLAPAIAGGLVGGAAMAGAYGALRITRTMVATRLDKSANRTQADAHWDDDINYFGQVAAQQNGIKNHNTPESTEHFASIVERRAHEDVKGNRVRFGTAAISLALGVGMGEVVGHVLGAAHHGVAHHNTDKHGGGHKDIHKSSVHNGKPGSNHGNASKPQGGNNTAGHNHGNKGGDHGSNTDHGTQKSVELHLKDLGNGNSDSIWRETANYASAHGHNASIGQLNHEVSQILAANHETWASAHDLQPGYTFHIPHEVLEEMAKTKTK